MAGWLHRVDLFRVAYPWIIIGWFRNLRRRRRIWLFAWQAGVPSIHRAWRPGGDRAWRLFPFPARSVDRCFDSDRRYDADRVGSETTTSRGTGFDTYSGWAHLRAVRINPGSRRPPGSP